MKVNGILAVMLINAVSWIVTGAVIYVAINATGNANWAFLLLIPALCGYSYKEKNDEKDGNCNGQVK